MCNGTPTTIGVPLTSAKASAPVSNEGHRNKNMTPNLPSKTLLTDEEVADDFTHPLTGQYRSVADGVPDHINPVSGHYKYGVRKCSKCKEFKHKDNFTSEEANKTADKRVCQCCMEMLKAYLT